MTSFPLTLHADRHPVDPSVLRDLASNLDMQLRHCVGGKLLDKHGTADAPRVTWPRGTASVLEGRERSQPYRTSTRSRVDIYTTDLTLASERARQSPSRSTQLVELPGSLAHGITPLHAVVTGEPTIEPGPLRPAPERLLRRTNSLPDLRKPSLSPDGAYAVPRTSHCGATQLDATAPQTQPHDDGACDTSTQSPCAKAMPNARSAGPPRLVPPRPENDRVGSVLSAT